MKSTILVLVLACLLHTSALADGSPPRAVVFDIANASKDRHTVMLRTATDMLALELGRQGAYEVVARSEMERAAAAHRLAAPYTLDDATVLAKALDANVMVTGEIRSVDSYMRDRQREVEVGLVVRVIDVNLGESVSGAAVRGVATDAPDGHKTEGELLMDAAESAASRAAARITSYKPIEGQVLNTSGRGALVLNRGLGNGVKPRQEFLVFRDGAKVGRLRAGQVYANYTEASVVDSTGGIQPMDRFIAVFPEPKLPPRER